MGNNPVAPAKIKCVRNAAVSPLSERRKYRTGNNASSQNNSSCAPMNTKKKNYRLSTNLDSSNFLYTGTHYCPENGLVSTGDRMQYPTSPIGCGTAYPDQMSGQPTCPQVVKCHSEFNEITDVHQHHRQSTTTLGDAYPRLSLDSSRFVALHDYTARVEDDLCMTKGQEFQIIDKSQGYWWYAKCLITNSLGYVPFNYLAPVKSLESNEWYFGEMRRLQAEQSLTMPGNAHGSFLVRISESRTGEYSLSVRDGEAVKHYRIRSRASRSNIDLRRYYISRQLPFVNIQQLVEHYMKNQSGLCCQLTTPCLRSTQLVPVGLSHNLVDKWEIPKSSVVLKERIGKGQFGEVYRAIWNGTTPVAVKTLRTNFCNVEDFLLEAQTMKRLHHPHLIQLYAVCTQSAPFYLVTELMSRGSLLSFLHSAETRSNLSMHALVLIAAQIASGMAYLESQHYIHRDLAARNVLVSEGNLVKIADFGLARMIQNKEYVAHAGARFPIKWTAPEAANYSRFTIKSDVWSFGILLTEIVTFGRVPYPGMHNAEVLRQVEAGYRMPAPPNCPPKLYDLMLECWGAEEDSRPSFAAIHTRLELFYDDERPAYKDPGATCDAVVPNTPFTGSHHPPALLAVSP